MRVFSDHLNAALYILNGIEMDLKMTWPANKINDVKRFKTDINVKLIFLYVMVYIASFQRKQGRYPVISLKFKHHVLDSLGLTNKALSIAFNKAF